jgi:hypothetical protein
VPRYHFPGHPAFLDAAAAENGLADAALAARRDATLAAVANLCSQAAEVDSRHVVGILAEAQALTDRLRVALHASDLMLEHVRSGRAVARPTSDPARRPKAGSRPVDPRGGRHA